LPWTINKSSAVAETGESLDTTDMGQKMGAVVPLLAGNVVWVEAYFHTKWHLDPSNRLATIHQRHRQDRQLDNGSPKKIIECQNNQVDGCVWEDCLRVVVWQQRMYDHHDVNLC